MRQMKCLFLYLQAVLLHTLQGPKHLQSPPLPVAFLFFLHRYCGIVWYETLQLVQLSECQWATSAAIFIANEKLLFFCNNNCSCVDAICTACQHVTSKHVEKLYWLLLLFEIRSDKLYEVGNKPSPMFCFVLFCFHLKYLYSWCNTTLTSRFCFVNISCPACCSLSCYLLVSCNTSVHTPQGSIYMYTSDSWFKTHQIPPVLNLHLESCWQEFVETYIFRVITKLKLC